jgi:hypothetical protein
LDRIEEVPVLGTVREALSGASSLEEGVRRALSHIGESMGWLFGACWEVDPGARQLRVRQTWCARAFRRTRFDDDSRAHRFGPGEGLPGRVWASGRAVWVVDTQQEADFPRHAAASREGLHAAVAFPACSAGVLYGVVEFYTDDLRAAPPALLPVFELLGDLIGGFMAAHGAAPAGPA